MAPRPEPVTVALLDAPWPVEPARAPSPEQNSPARPSPVVAPSPPSPPIEARPDARAAPHRDPAGGPGLRRGTGARAHRRRGWRVRPAPIPASPGRACDMARWLQDALRKDPLVRAAVAQAQGPGADQAAQGPPGLERRLGSEPRRRRRQGARGGSQAEAIMCGGRLRPAGVPRRAPSVRGLVLISLNEGPGSARLVVGSPAWRWSDLLLARPAP